MHAAQQYAAALPCPPEYYPASSAASSSNASVNNPYLAQDDGHAQNFASSFSTGSTFAYPHQDYRYLLDRGDGAYELCTPRLVDSGLDATGLGFTGNHHSASSSSAFEPQPEEITVYQHQQPTASWGWMDPTGPAAAPDHEIVAPAPIYPAGSAEAQYFGAGVCQAQTHENADADATGNSAHPQVHIHGNQEVQQQQPLVVAHPAPLPIQTPVGAAQLPTPAAMAVLLSPREGRSAREPAQTGYGIIPPPSSASRRSIGGHRLSGSTSNIATSISSGDSAAVVPRNATLPGAAAAATRASRAAEAHPVVATQQVVPMIPDSIIREKKHACTMCHKRFDRPSTLRKHLLVHTGEKAFVCDTCGRRFGVASNLNRHVKRCILKPVNSPPLPSSKTPHDAAEAAALASSVTGPSIHMSSTNRMSASARRARGPSSSNSPASSSASGDFNSTSSSTLSTLSSSSTLSSPSSSIRGRDSTNINLTSTPTNSANRPPGQKRRRRAPSPSQWVPHTLQNFNLQSEDFYSICPQLLPVVYDPPREERNNFDENISPTPYHPSGWNGVLPGPGSPHCGLGGKDVRNYGFGGGRGEYMVGRIQLVC